MQRQNSLINDKLTKIMYTCLKLTSYLQSSKGFFAETHHLFLSICESLSLLNTLLPFFNVSQKIFLERTTCNSNMTISVLHVIDVINFMFTYLQPAVLCRTIRSQIWLSMLKALSETSNIEAVEESIKFAYKPLSFTCCLISKVCKCISYCGAQYLWAVLFQFNIFSSSYFSFQGLIGKQYTLYV